MSNLFSIVLLAPYSFFQAKTPNQEKVRSLETMIRKIDTRLYPKFLDILYKHHQSDIAEKLLNTLGKAYNFKVYFISILELYDQG